VCDREDDRCEEDVGLCVFDRCLDGISTFPPGTRVDELRTTVGVAEEVAVAMSKKKHGVFQDRLLLRYS
jgi:hypothetical protein